MSDVEFGGAYTKGLFKGVSLRGTFGYNFYNLFLEDQAAESSSELVFSSFMLGAQVGVPVSKKITLISSFGLSILEGAEFENDYLGAIENSSRYRFYFGADFKKILAYSFSSGINIDSINIDFSNDQRDFGITNLTFINSMNFNF